MDVSAGGLNLGAVNFGPDMSGTVTPAATTTLGAFDGVKDFAGASGTVIAGTFRTGEIRVGLSDAPDLARFTGSGTVDLSITSDGSSDVSANATLRSFLDINAGGVGTLQYQYVPPRGAGSASPSLLCPPPPPLL